MLYGAFKGPRAKIRGHTWLLPSLEHALQIISIKNKNLFMYAKMFEIVPNCCQL
jgi:hypothetical protein